MPGPGGVSGTAGVITNGELLPHASIYTGRHADVPTSTLEGLNVRLMAGAA